MNPRSTRHGKQRSLLRSGKYWALLIVIAAIVGLFVIFTLPAESSGPGKQAKVEPTPASTSTPTPQPVIRKAIDFEMQDWDHGWIKYTDGYQKTEDGGVQWTEAGSAKPEAEMFEEFDPQLARWLKEQSPKPSTLQYESQSYQVAKSQFLNERVGWALLTDSKELSFPILVTVDGGETWHEQVTPALKTVIDEERERVRQMQQEASLYTGSKEAQLALQSAWTLLPDTASPGDVILVRHQEPGEIEWQDKTYILQPYGAGYFTYLPIPISLKPGTYPIGDQQLTVTDKKFDTQYLKVTKQMESMRQETDRIQADQKKINEARSKSEPEFLFTTEFMQPIEGILTTPFGYTRYVNDKLDSRHMAIDLAADEGTPIHATNDGIVALADSLYLTGNSIYIDHGMNLFSQYAHLSKLLVSAGDKVKKGDVIGLVGSTGFSTGPHLHFTFWAHNVPVNPNLFFDSTPFQWLQEPPDSDSAEQSD